MLRSTVRIMDIHACSGPGEGSDGLMSSGSSTQSVHVKREEGCLLQPGISRLNVRF